jgi:hypothetical protein
MEPPRARTLLLAWAVGSLLALGAAAPPARPHPPTFSARFAVRETEIVVDPPDDQKRLKARDLRVFVDGKPADVARVERLGKDGSWTFVVYVDPQLAGAATRFASLLALADRAPALTRLGAVEILSAASGRPVLAATRDARALRSMLGDLAGAARLERDRVEASNTAALAATATAPALRPAIVERCLDRFATALAERRPRGPHAVFLLTDAAAPPLPQVFERTAGALAGYGWVTFPLALRKELVREEMVSGPSELEIFRRSSDAGAKNGISVPPLLPGRSPRPTPLTVPGVLELSLDPALAGVRTLAQQTAGGVIGREVQLDPALEHLGRRFRVWVDEPAAPVEGRLRRLEVSLARQGIPVRAPGWLRSSTPAEIAAARLRRLLAGEELAAPLRLAATWLASADGRQVRLELSPAAAPSGEEAEEGRPLRASWAWIGAGGKVEMRSATFRAQHLDEAGWIHALPLDLPAGGSPVRRVALIVDDLDSERWGAVVLAARP